MTLDQTGATTGNGLVRAQAPSRAHTLGAMILRAARIYGESPALRHREGDHWEDLSYADLGTAAREIGGGLISLGIEPGDRVAILSNTRPEWVLADAGALCAAAVVVPVYQTNSPEECRYVLGHSEARVVFCEDEQQLAKVEQVRDELPGLEHTILLTGSSPGAIALDDLRGRGVTHVATVELRAAAVGPEDLATIVYTSGTTGPPKGCMLTHDNLMSTVGMYVERERIGRGVFFMFLPLAHVMARTTELFTLEIGATLAFWQRDPAKLLEDLRDARPTHFAAVPRLFEKIYTAASAGVAEQPAVKRAVFRHAIATGRRVRERERRGRRPGPVLRAAYALADRLVLRKIRSLFGPDLKFAISGAAPIAMDVLEFFAAAGIPVLEGYGMTETTAAGAINAPGSWQLGTVGRALPPTRLRVAEDGEVLMAGPHVFAGYYKNPGATAETLVDGWIHTGDLGSIDGHGYLTITGRKKEIIITSSGKNVTPSNIENALKECRWISEAVIYGDAHPYLVALITLDQDQMPKLAERLGIASDPAAMAADARVRAEIQAAVDAVNERFARIEQVKRFTILDHDLSQAEGELTPTLKVKRRAVYDRYGAELADLYSQ